MPSWTPTDGADRPPDGARCVVSWTEEGNEHFDLSVYLGGSDQWDDSVDVYEHVYKPFTHYECFIALPDRT